jgi:hypothetical protein
MVEYSRSAEGNRRGKVRQDTSIEITYFVLIGEAGECQNSLRIGCCIGSYFEKKQERRNEPAAWWAILGSNQWLLPCEGSALPLS